MSLRSAHTKIFDMVVYSQLGVIMFAFKMVMASLPNIEPVSLLTIIYTVTLGIKALLPIYVYVMLEYLVWGFNLWSIAYLYVWAILWMIAYVFREVDHPLFWAIISGIFGLSFGGLCSLVYIPLNGCTHALLWWISGIPFDLLHSAGNFVAALVLYRPLKDVFQALKENRGP